MKISIADSTITAAATMLSEARNVAVLTGAGISRESGIPTFREAQTGLWANYDPETLATPQGFLKDPALVWSWYESRRKMVASVQPNAGHYALAELETLIAQCSLITQNVDGLHRKAGSSGVIELHGNLNRHKCFDHGHAAKAVADDLDEPPRCHCGSLVRPAVVWFGEDLDRDDLSRATASAESADVFLVVGTSGLVHPAASLPAVARRHGAKVIECNIDRTPISKTATLFLSGPAGVVLPRVVQEIRKMKELSNT